MKKIALSALVAAGMLMWSCDKEKSDFSTPQSINSNQNLIKNGLNDLQSQIASSEITAPFFNGRMLQFANEASYIATLDQMKNFSTQELLDWELSIPFNSLRAKDALAESLGTANSLLSNLPASGIEDDLIKSILNHQKQFQIGHFVYTLNTSTQMVEITSSIPNAQFQVYNPTDQSTTLRNKISLGFDVNVLDMVEEDPTPSPGPVGISIYKIIFDVLGGPGDCSNPPGDKDDELIENVDGKKQLDCKLVYQKVGVYFSIIAKVKSQRNSGVAFNADLYTKMDYSFTIRCDGAIKEGNATDHNCSTCDSQDKNKSQIRIYEGPNGLQEFNVRVDFDYNNGTFHTRNFNING